jgi:hypothetical protein
LRSICGRIVTFIEDFEGVAVDADVETFHSKIARQESTSMRREDAVPFLNRAVTAPQINDTQRLPGISCPTVNTEFLCGRLATRELSV